LLERQGLLVRDAESDYLNFEPGEALDQLIGASIRYRIAIGPNAGRKALTLRTVPAQPEPFASTLLAKQPGFSLHAATCCESLAFRSTRRPAVRPNNAISWKNSAAISPDLPSRTNGCRSTRGGKSAIGSKSPHVVLDPLDFIARLAALVPRPRLNLTRFHGVFAPNCRHREHIVPRHERKAQPHNKPLAPMTWMQRLKRVFG
jgi:hypothetical protein